MTGNQPSKAQTHAHDIWVPGLRVAGVAIVAAALLLMIFCAFTFRWIHPEFVPFMDRETSKLVASGKDLIPVSVGGYRLNGSSFVIEDFNGDEAVLALPRTFQAEDFPFIKVQLEGLTRYTKFKILWRQASAPERTHALEFRRNDDGAAQIAMVYDNEHYQGRIKDIALLFFDGPARSVTNNNNAEILIHHIELRPFSIRYFLTQVYDDWFHATGWTPSSNNIVQGSHTNAILAPNLAINLLCVCTLMLAHIWCTFQAILGRPNPTERFFSITCGVLFLVWLLSETLRWPARIDQAADSVDRYYGKALETRIITSSDRCGQYPEDCHISLHPYF